MAIKYTIEQHMWGFPTKIQSANGGGHIFNITLIKDMDNCSLVGRGNWLGLDVYQQAAVPTSGSPAKPNFSGKIQEQAANGNWYVELLEDTDAIWIYDAVVIPEDYNREFSKESNFYNESGKTVKGYSLHKGDILELATACFDGTPAKNSAVGYDATKNLYTV